ncbi:MAG: NADH-quinone oxidoreductase subunit M [Gemmataceae bacterium]|nr:NADH-quinone oxidoreductase subunit M [Gemmataceae bacterium]
MNLDYRLALVLLLAVPAAAAIVCALLGRTRGHLIRWVALAATLVNVFLALYVALGFLGERNYSPVARTPFGMAVTFQPELVPGADPADIHRTTWKLIDFGRLGAIQFYIGLDGINVWLIVLTAVLLVPSVLISWNSITERVNEYYAWLLTLGAGMLGVFLAFDIILFYIFFELTLVPLFFLIGIWGGPERRYAARKFFIYTLAGSLLTFLGLLAVVVVCYHKPVDITAPELTFSIPDLVRAVNTHLMMNLPADRAFWSTFQFWVFLALFAGFAIKVPLVPVHTWLPLAHVEAPTAGSVLLAGVLLKLGTYGFLRLCLPLAPDASLQIGLPLIGVLSVIGIIYGAFCALAQSDIKKLVAYSSISHLGFCMLGMFAFNLAGLTGGLLQMINHGLSTGALFLLVGMLYDRYHTRQMADFGGMGAKLGALTFCMVFICLASVGLPGLNGFVGEALVFFGMFEVRPLYAVLGAAGIVLGAWYLLSMLKGVFFGPLKEPEQEGHPIKDLDSREVAAIAPIMALCLFLGVYPQPVIRSAQDDLRIVETLLQNRKPVLAANQTGDALAQEPRQAKEPTQ